MTIEEASIRIEKLEQVVFILARGLLQYQYEKDLCRNGTEDACQALANDENIDAALLAVS